MGKKNTALTEAKNELGGKFKVKWETKDEWAVCRAKTGLCDQLVCNMQGVVYVSSTYSAWVSGFSMRNGSYVGVVYMYLRVVLIKSGSGLKLC
jgi:hypothetical protein